MFGMGVIFIMFEREKDVDFMFGVMIMGVNFFILKFKVMDFIF